MKDTDDTAWTRCGPWLEAALAHAGDSHGLEDVRALVEDGRARLWAGARSALVATIENDPRERRLLLWLAGGALDELTAVLRPAAEAWGRAMGCTRAMIIGRPGWEHVLRDDGYRPVARLIAKDLR